MNKILLIEDNRHTSELVSLVIKAEGFDCDTVNMGYDGLSMAKMYKYDLILLDLVLGDMSGYKVLETIRSNKIDTPVLILSGLTDFKSRVNGLDTGADDYLMKPFNRSELVARIKALIRRSRGFSSPTINITNRFRIHTDRQIAEVDSKVFYLTNREYDIVHYFATHPGRVITKEMFLRHLYGGIDEPELKIIDVFMCKLRKKLHAALGEEADKIIETVWGRGYMMNILQPNNSESSSSYSSAPQISTQVIEESNQDFDMQTNMGYKKSNENIDKLRESLQNA